MTDRGRRGPSKGGAAPDTREAARRQARAVGERLRAEAQAVAEEARRAAADVREEARRAARDVREEALEAAQEVRAEALREAQAARHGRAFATGAPIWLRPEPGVRRARLTREEIAQAALALADAEGIEAVSMRRVAATLGVGTMSLYHYVRTKAELVELMSDAMMAEVVVPEGELPAQWRAALVAIATRTVATFRRHPWAIGWPPTAPGPNTMRHFDQSLQAVAPLPVDFATRVEIIALIDDFTFGFVLREAHDAREREALTEASLAAVADYMEAQIATGQFPHLEAVASAASSTRAAIDEVNALMHDDARFARGLERLLDGIGLHLGLDAPV